MAFNITGSTLSTSSSNNNFQLKDVIKDFSLWLLIITNISTIYIAMKEGWDLPTMMWVYWFQSVIIGFFNIIKILSLKDFTSKDFSINGKTFEPTIATKVRAASLFLLYYGIFHLVYLVYLVKNTMGENHSGEAINLHSQYFTITVAIFFLNHLFSFFYNLVADTTKQKLGAVAGSPFKRILPMHFIIIFGSFVSAGPLLFLLIKTAFDCKMHINEHGSLQKKELPQMQSPV